MAYHWMPPQRGPAQISEFPFFTLQTKLQARIIKRVNVEKYLMSKEKRLLEKACCELRVQSTAAAATNVLILWSAQLRLLIQF